MASKCEKYAVLAAVIAPALISIVGAFVFKELHMVGIVWLYSQVCASMCLLTFEVMFHLVGAIVGLHAQDTKED